MMSSVYGASAYGGNTMGYETVESLLEDVSRQMASSNITRYSRGSAGQTGQRTGGSMRIVKPNSTSNSPRGSIGLGRRRTVMTDRRRPTAADQNAMVPGGHISNEELQIPARSNRPVSWHPSSQIPPQPQYHSTYPMAPPNTQNEFFMFDLPPTPVVYSSYASPNSNFSPLSLPFNGYNNQYPFQDCSIPYPSNQGYTSIQQSTLGQPSQYYGQISSGDTDSSMCSHLDWSNFATNGFEGPTAPPTPENFLPIQYPDTSLPADDAIPYHSLSDSEPEGEILQGLGLYDNPEIAKSPPSDPHFDSYRSLVMSQLLGPAYRKAEPESTGKGLKLEETWNPPASDDEDDEEDDEQDGEGEDEEEEISTRGVERESHTLTSFSTAKIDSAQVNSGVMDATNFVPNMIQANHSVQQYSSTWL